MVKQLSATEPITPAQVPMKGAVVNLSPLSMTDSVAEWPLHRVVDHLKNKEQEDGALPDDSRISYRSSIRLLNSAIGDAAKRYGTSHSRMCKWLSYHAIAIAKNSSTISNMSVAYAQLNRACLEAADADTIDMLNTMIPYSPKNIEERSGTLHLHSPWIRSEFQELASVCGVYSYRIAQVFVMQSLMTGDHEALDNLMREFTVELVRWNKWMKMRLGVITSMLGKNIFDD